MRDSPHELYFLLLKSSHVIRHLAHFENRGFLLADKFFFQVASASHGWVGHLGGWWWVGGAHNCTFCPSPRWILEITRLVAQMANIAGLLALVVAEIFDWLADMLVICVKHLAGPPRSNPFQLTTCLVNIWFPWLIDSLRDRYVCVALLAPASIHSCCRSSPFH